MKTHTWLLAFVLILPLASYAQTEGDWERCLHAASRIYPQLADPSSPLSQRTATLRVEWASSGDAIKREAVRINAALVIAEAAKAEVDAAMTAQQEAEAERAAQASRAATEKVVIAKYPDAAVPSSPLTLAANRIIGAWTRSADPRIYKPDALMIVYDQAHAEVLADTERRAILAKREREAALAAREAELDEQERQKYENAAIAKYPAAADPRSLLSYNAERLRQKWLAARDIRLWQVNAPMLLYDAANVQTEQEVRQAQAYLAAEQGSPRPTPTVRQPRPPTSRFITVIETVPGMWQTSDGDTIIQTVPGHWQTSSGALIIQTAPGHYQIIED